MAGPRPSRGLVGLSPTPGQALAVKRGRTSPQGSRELVMAVLRASWSMSGRAAAHGNIDSVVWAGRLTWVESSLQTGSWWAQGLWDFLVHCLSTGGTL